MKKKKQNLLIVMLYIALAFSLILNWFQGEQVGRMMNEIKDLESTQSLLSSYIEELECTEGEECGIE